MFICSLISSSPASRGNRSLYLHEQEDHLERRSDNFHPYLEPPGEELVLDLQEVPSVHLSFERLVEDGELDVVLDVLPASVTVSEESGGLRATTSLSGQTDRSENTTFLHLQRESSEPITGRNKGYCMMPASSQ